MSVDDCDLCGFDACRTDAHHQYWLFAELPGNGLCHSCCAVYCLAFVRWGSTMVDILVDWHPPMLGTCFDGSFLALAMVNLIVFEHVEMY